MNKFILFIVLCMLSATALGNTTLYVQSARAKIMDQPSFKGKNIQSVTKGTSVEAMETRGNWIKVRYENTVGWVSKLLLSTNPPQAKPSVLEGKHEELKGNARRRASDNTTAAATRGLRSENRSRISDAKHADYEALDKMESQQVSEDDARKFHDEGLKK